MSVRIPPTKSYLVGYINEDLEFKRIAAGDPEYEEDWYGGGTNRKYRARLGAVKVENQSGGEVELLLELYDPNNVRQHCVEASVGCGSYSITNPSTNEEEVRFHGAWIFVPPRQSGTDWRVKITASAGGRTGPSFTQYVVPTSYVAHIGNPSGNVTGTHEYNYVYFLDDYWESNGRSSSMELRNYVDAEYLLSVVWRSSDPVDVRRWTRDLGFSIMGKRDHEAYRQLPFSFGPPPEDAPEGAVPCRLEVSAAQSGVTPESATFELFDLGGDLVELRIAADGNVTSAPHAITPSNGRVRVFNDTGGDLCVWEEGNRPPEDSEGNPECSPESETHAPLGHRQVKELSVPFIDAEGKRYQSSVHWQPQGDDPKVIIKQDDCGSTGPSRDW